MNYNPYSIEPKQLVSDSLKDVLTEENIEQVEEMFISVGLVIEPKEHSLTGNLSGIEFGDYSTKIEIKASMRDAFNFIGQVITNDQHSKLSSSLILLMGKDVVNIQGPFSICGVKVIEMEPTSKLCILSVDLVKSAP